MPRRPDVRARLILALVVVFLVSRVIYHHVGVRFDAWALTNSWQLLPQDLLHHDLVKSIWYQHSQPPLFNVIVGITLHLPHPYGLLNLGFVACTLALTIVAFLAMLELRVPPWLAFVAAAVFAVSPTTVIYENWMYYTYPVALMSVTAVWRYTRYLRTRHLSDAAIVSVMLTGLALTRASYHLVFVVAGGVFVFCAAKKAARKRVAAVFAIPLLLVGGLYLKNYILFGEPNSSSWLGMNLAHALFGNYPDEVHADVASGAISPQAETPAFLDLGAYGVHHRPTGVSALDRPLKEQGVNNYNNISYIQISRRYQKDSFKFIKRHPDLYARVVGDSFRTMFVPASDFIGVQYQKPNFAHLRKLIRLENRLLGQVREYEQPGSGLNTQASPHARDVAWLVVLGYAATVVAGAVVALQLLRRRRVSVERIAFLFLAFIVTYAVVSSNLFELGENMRFRLESDPLVLVGVTALLSAAGRRITSARADRSIDLGDELVILDSDGDGELVSFGRQR